MRQIVQENDQTSPKATDADWDLAQSELLEREGIDLKLEMETKMNNMMDRMRRMEADMEATGAVMKNKDERISSLEESKAILNLHLPLSILMKLWCP